jgi:hypothetical protein
MNILACILSLLLANFACAQVIVTVIHPTPVTVMYDPALDTVYPVSTPSAGSNVPDQVLSAQDADGSFHARATSRFSVKYTTFPTGATTDVNSAFGMNVPFVFGTVAAFILAAIIF